MPFANTVRTNSLRSVSVIAGVLGRAGERGQARRKADANKGVCTWRNQPDMQKWMDDEKAKAGKEAQAEREAARAGAPNEGGMRSIF